MKKAKTAKTTWRAGKAQKENDREDRQGKINTGKIGVLKPKDKTMKHLEENTEVKHYAFDLKTDS